MVHTKRNLARENAFFLWWGISFSIRTASLPSLALQQIFFYSIPAQGSFPLKTETPSWLLTTLYCFDGSLGTEEQACFISASEELTLGCCKKDKYQKILMSVTVLKAGRVPGGPPLCMLEEWRNTLHHRHKSGWAWTFLVERDGDSISGWELFLNGCPNQLVCFSAINRNYHLD